MGGCAGVCLTVGGSTSDGPLQSGFTSDSGLYVEANVGWGPSVGISAAAQGDILDPSTWMNPIESGSVAPALRVGVGLGFGGGFGQYQSFQYTTPARGDDCECN